MKYFIFCRLTTLSILEHILLPMPRVLPATKRLIASSVHYHVAIFAMHHMRPPKSYLPLFLSTYTDLQYTWVLYYLHESIGGNIAMLPHLQLLLSPRAFILIYILKIKKSLWEYHSIELLIKLFRIFFSLIFSKIF